ncbi:MULTISPECIES: beta-ketoacyl-ACP synthase III [unclassified Helicobacter]|uniref:beta-ketoacyl-ACP synthase III n=1 Tax=unclassified Helicobacter TaxID=2593540 RepID=UPI0018F80569|nr:MULTISPECIES: beta-ketoacyl-ACP synthase III [unclassified Helicobacter]
MFASLKSIASYVPKNCVSNFDFEKMVDTSNDWIVERTGIHTRYFASKDQKTSDLAYEAGKLAIQRAKLKPSDIDMVIVGTLSPDYLGMPSTACVVANKLGIIDKPAFDISAACSGFIYLLFTAKSFIESGMCKNILIIGAEKISSILDFQDRSTCVLFGDGAGAAVVGTTNSKERSIIDVHISSNGGYANLLYTPLSTLQEEAKQCLNMKGNEVFKVAVKTLISDVEMILQKNKVLVEEIAFFIPHQANLRIISAVGKRLEFKEEQVVLTVQKYGNTSAASIPMAMNDVYEDKRLKNGDLILLDAFGGGFTWGSALLRFDGENF